MLTLMKVKMKLLVQCPRLLPETDIVHIHLVTSLIQHIYFLTCTQNMRHKCRPRKTVLNGAEYLPKWNLIAFKNKTEKVA